MSVFRVRLSQPSTGRNRNSQGYLDSHVGVDTTYSVQRTMYAMGPNKINRKLADGQTFTDCNYWKRFAYPQVAYVDSFIDVVTDDGSVYIDGQVSTYPRVYARTIVAGTSYSATNNIINIFEDNGGYAVSGQITVRSGSGITAKLNDLSTALLTVASGTTQSFQSGETLSKIAIDNSASGATNSSVEVLVFIQSTCNS